MSERIRTLLSQSLLNLGNRLEVPLANLEPGSSQPRRRMESIAELAESIRAHGVLQPLLVQPSASGKYRIICGERRFLAARMAGLKEVPVRIVDVSDEEAKALALIENLQREDLNPYEETVGILDLLALKLGLEREEVASALHKMLNTKKKKATQNVLGKEAIEEVFKALGRFTWESFVQTRLPLLSLPEDLHEALAQGRIPYTAALELKRVRDQALRIQLLQEVEQGMSLRDLRARIKAHLRQTASPKPFYRQALSRLAKIKLETLPAQKQKAVEKKLKELLRLLEAEETE